MENSGNTVPAVILAQVRKEQTQVLDYQVLHSSSELPKCMGRLSSPPLSHPGSRELVARTEGFTLCRALSPCQASGKYRSSGRHLKDGPLLVVGCASLEKRWSQNCP